MDIEIFLETHGELAAPINNINTTRLLPWSKVDSQCSYHTAGKHWVQARKTVCWSFISIWKHEILKKKSHRLFPYKFLACPFLLAHVVHFHPAIIHKDAYRWYITNFGSLKDINTIYVEVMICIYQGHQTIYFSMYKTGE